MYLQEILEVAVGLVFMWLVISVAAMSLQEWLANLLKWRAKDLRNAIRKMLADPALAKEFYDHQLIRGLSKDINWFQKAWNRLLNFFRRLFKQEEQEFDNLPSYIPRGDFALTIFDLLMKAGAEASPIQNAFRQVKEALDSLKEDQINFESKEEAGKALQTLLDMARDVAVSDIGQEAVDSVKLQAQKFAADYPQLQSALDQVMPQVEEYYRRLIEEKKNAPPDAAAAQDKTLQRLRLGLVAIGMNNPKLQESLRSLLNGVEGYITEKETALLMARTNVETWFDNSMARLSGWYKRKAQLTSFLIGLFLAVLLNVDSIALASTLWREPTLRQTIVAQAEAYYRQNETLPQSGEATAAPPPKTITKLQEELAALKIPFGWETEPYFVQAGETCQIIPLGPNAVWGIWSKDVCKRVSNVPPDATGWLSKIAGILMTALAAAQGAPFWFDILKKLVNVRSSGPNPSETQAKG